MQNLILYQFTLELQQDSTMAQAQVELLKFSLNIQMFIKNCETPVWYNFQESKFKIHYEKSGVEISSKSFKEIVNHLIQTHQISIVDHCNQTL